jgi:5-(carboxyamino)imidazole ribonucleotide mutase
MPTENAQKPLVGVVMGSTSDWPFLEPAAQLLDAFEIPWERGIFSAHRLPDEMSSYGRTAHKRGLKVIIASAGGAAHLPGMLASKTPLPVIGVPRPQPILDGVDALLSIVQMPKGIPVATMAIGEAGAANAAVMALRILGTSDERYAEKALAYAESLRQKVLSEPDPSKGEYSSPWSTVISAEMLEGLD